MLTKNESAWTTSVRLLHHQSARDYERRTAKLDVTQATAN